jgi:CHASE1-domain containing sensor protein
MTQQSQNIRLPLFISLLLIGLVPAIIVVLVATSHERTSLSQQITTQLDAVRQARTAVSYATCSSYRPPSTT